MSSLLRIDSTRAMSPEYPETRSVSLDVAEATAYNFALKIFDQRWEQENQPPVCSEDLEEGLSLFSAIAIEKAKKKHSCGEEDFLLKVTAFIQKHANSFWHVCKIRFPFNELEMDLAQAALKEKLKHPEDSILLHFMNFKGEMNHTELTEYFENVLDSVHPSEIGHACYCLAEICMEANNPKAGHHLLWLLKTITGISYEIPEKELCGSEKVREVFSLFFSQGGYIQHPDRFLEILYYYSPDDIQFLFDWLLMPTACNVLFNWAISQFVEIPAQTWPGKFHTLANFFERVMPQDRAAVAKKLLESPDEETAEIGRCFLEDIANIFAPVTI